jgi:hypothetical protein
MMYETEEGDAFAVPDNWIPDAHTGHCRSCDAMIVWCITPNKKKAPVNPDGTSHFSNCPEASRWRRTK